MKRIVYQRNRLTTIQKIRRGLKRVRKSVADFLFKIYLFIKLLSVFKKWPDDLKLPLPIAVIENE